MFRSLTLSAVIAAAVAAPVQAADLHFCWRGANGFTMTGEFGVPDSALTGGMITEDQISYFRITGYEVGIPVGRWSMDDLAAGSTFHLRFDTATMSFPTGGSYPGPASQGWNANGEVNNCGDKGFGFNSGNHAQDLCLYGVWVEHSSIAPQTPLRASTVAYTPDCRLRDFSS